MQLHLAQINLLMEMELKAGHLELVEIMLIGTAGSNLDTDTYNITYYSTSPIENDTKFFDTIIGFGKLNSDLLTVIDRQKLTAERDGRQIYGTIRIKDEIKKDNLTNQKI